VNVGIKLFNIRTKEIENDKTGHLVEHHGFFFRKVAYYSDDVSVFLVYVGLHTCML